MKPVGQDMGLAWEPLPAQVSQFLAWIRKYMPCLCSARYLLYSNVRVVLCHAEVVRYRTAVVTAGVSHSGIRSYTIHYSIFTVRDQEKR